MDIVSSLQLEEAPANLPTAEPNYHILRFIPKGLTKTSERNKRLTACLYSKLPKGLAANLLADREYSVNSNQLHSQLLWFPLNYAVGGNGRPLRGNLPWVLPP